MSSPWTLWLWGGISLLVGIGVALWSYGRLPVRLPTLWRYILGTLRALAVAALLFLLAEPLHSYIRQEEKPPLIVLLADNSQSVFWGGAISVDAYTQGIQALVKALEDAGFTVQTYALDKGIKAFSRIDGQGTYSWLSVGIAEAIQELPQAAALILVSDGQESGEKMAPLPLQVPVWTIGVGPSKPAGDAAIEAIALPTWATEGQPIEVSFQLRLPHTAGLLFIETPNHYQRIPVSLTQPTLRVTLPALPKGTHTLRFTLEVPQDPNPFNNHQQRLLTVQSAQPAFVLWAGELTPDIAFFRRTLEKIGKVTLILPRKPSGFTYPPDSALTDPTALAIWYNFPARPEDLPWAQKLLREAPALVVIWGSSGPPAALLQEMGLQTLGPLVPYTLPGGSTVYLHTPLLTSNAYPIDIGWGRPIGYRRFQGNRLHTFLLGEGWWQIRENPTWLTPWDSALTRLLQEALFFQQNRFVFAPERLQVRPGEALYWRGWLPPTSTFYIADQPVPLLPGGDGLYEAVWTPDSVGLYPYVVRNGTKILLQGTIWVADIPQELFSIGRDSIGLQYMAQRTGGQYFSWERRAALLPALKTAIPPHTLVSSQRIVIPFHEWNVWLIGVLTLFSAEWLLRRYVGLY